MMTDLNAKQTGTRRLPAFLLKNGLYLFLIALLAIIIAINPSFFRMQNFVFIMTQASTRIILALGVAGIIVLMCRPFSGQECGYVGDRCLFAPSGG